MTGRTAALLIIGIPVGLIVGALALCVVLDLLDAHRTAAARSAACTHPGGPDATVLPFAGRPTPLRSGVEVYGTAPDDDAA